jgi:hypothetical protein
MKMAHGTNMDKYTVFRFFLACTAVHRAPARLLIVKFQVIVYNPNYAAL